MRLTARPVAAPFPHPGDELRRTSEVVPAPVTQQLLGGTDPRTSRIETRVAAHSFLTALTMAGLLRRAAQAERALACAPERVSWR